MRISVFPDDPGYTIDLAHDVYLDGIKVLNCYTADDSTGEVVVFDKAAPLGDWLETVPTVTLRGDVKIEPIVDRWYFR